MGITYASLVPAPIAETFEWHERPGAIERLTPPFQPVRVISEADDLSGGTAVLRLPGGLRWVADHEGYDPPHAFVDRLTSLPLQWRHTHRFEAQGPATTLVTDDVETPVPARLLRPMFVYRHRQLADDLLAHQDMRAMAPKPLSIGVTGASGLVGRSLCPLLTTGGHHVVRFVRRSAIGADERSWDPQHPDPAAFDDLDVVVHLAGASIAGRFNDNHKQQVRQSRVGPTARLAEALTQARRPPSVLVCASAIGIYGPDRGPEELTEESMRGEGFLADLVDDWERDLSAAEDAGIRCVRVRTGIVQSPRGGVLRLQWPLFTMGLGGTLGSGNQWLSWIDVDDLSDIYYRAIVDRRCAGPLNAVSPHPVTVREHAHTLARVLRRPALIPVPEVALQLALGREGSREVAMASQRVVPGVLSTLGHRFRRPGLEACLRHQLGRFDRSTSPDEN